jgi:hypothetical protein
MRLNRLSTPGSRTPAIVRKRWRTFTAGNRQWMCPATNSRRRIFPIVWWTQRYQTRPKGSRSGTRTSIQICVLQRLLESHRSSGNGLPHIAKISGRILRGWGCACLRATKTSWSYSFQPDGRAHHLQAQRGLREVLHLRRLCDVENRWPTVSRGFYHGFARISVRFSS